MALNTLTKQSAYDEIRNYIVSNTLGSNYSSWYVGIANDPERRLFQEHEVNRENGRWIYTKCYSDSSAREVENTLIENLGTQGGPGGGDDSTIFVYAYEIKSYTNE